MEVYGLAEQVRGNRGEFSSSTSTNIPGESSHILTATRDKAPYPALRDHEFGDIYGDKIYISNTAISFWKGKIISKQRQDLSLSDKLSVRNVVESLESIEDHKQEEAKKKENEKKESMKKVTMKKEEEEVSLIDNKDCLLGRVIVWQNELRIPSTLFFGASMYK